MVSTMAKQPQKKTAPKNPRAVSFNLSEEAAALLAEYERAMLPVTVERTSVINASLVAWLRAELAKRKAQN